MKFLPEFLQNVDYERGRIQTWSPQHSLCDTRIHRRQIKIFSAFVIYVQARGNPFQVRSRGPTVLFFARHSKTLQGFERFGPKPVMRSDSASKKKPRPKCYAGARDG